MAFKEEKPHKHTFYSVFFLFASEHLSSISQAKSVIVPRDFFIHFANIYIIMTDFKKMQMEGERFAYKNFSHFAQLFYDLFKAY